jgi:ZIP family zinc transporter
MNNLLKISLFAYFSGFPIIAGGMLSSFVQKKKIRLRSEINHWFIAFAGGSLISAIAFALVPRGSAFLSVVELVGLFLGGTLTFMMIDILVAKAGESLGVAISMMMDFIPEILALGATFTYNPGFGLFLAILIGLQNFPEGFGSYIELTKKISGKRALLLMFGLSLLGPIAALGGDFFLRNSPTAVAMIMVFAAGGIMYLIFQDIAPLSSGKNDWIPATGASVGFIIGMIGQKLLL